MKVLVLNLSGNVGKSVIAKNLFYPRMPGVEYFEVESINETEGEGEQYTGKQYSDLIANFNLYENAIVDVGSSNIESFLKQVRDYKGSLKYFDLFAVPVVGERKQIIDTINTIITLNNFGVNPDRIRIIFNKVDEDDFDRAFSRLFEYHQDFPDFHLNRDIRVPFNQIYPESRFHRVTLEKLMLKTADDYQRIMRKLHKEMKAIDEKIKNIEASENREELSEEKERLIHLLKEMTPQFRAAQKYFGLRMLAETAIGDLDKAFALVTKGINVRI